MQEEKESRPGGTDAIDNPAPESEPLSEQEIAKEARRIMASLPYAYPQDQTVEGQIPVRVSPEFMVKAKPPEMNRLREQIPVEGATFGAMKDRAGLYVLFPADEAKAAANNRACPMMKFTGRSMTKCPLSWMTTRLIFCLNRLKKS